MDIEYFEKQIHDELCGATDYIKKAIELKPMAKAWSDILYDMARTEKTHADNLYKMSVEYYNKIEAIYKNVPSYIKDSMDNITKEYTESLPMLSLLFASYKE